MWTIQCSCGRSADSARQSVHGHKRQPPHKARKETQGQSQHDTHGRLVKAGLTFDQLVAKYTGKTPFYATGQQRNLGHPLKQNSPKDDATSIAYSLYHGRMLCTHLLIVDVLSCSNMEWYDDEPWYMRTPFVYSGWGHLHSIPFDPLIK
jgi:hypothetical protein